MKVAIIGTGGVGQTIASKLFSLGLYLMRRKINSLEGNT